MVLRGHHSPRARLAVVSVGIESGVEPTRIMHFPEGFTIFDASVVVEEPDRLSADDLDVICEECLTDRHPGLESGWQWPRSTEKRGSSTGSGYPCEDSEPGTAHPRRCSLEASSCVGETTRREPLPMLRFD